jgi:hypothetical protein
VEETPDEEPEADVTQQAGVIVHLYRSNSRRWQEMGYEPPSLPSLVSAASKADFPTILEISPPPIEECPLPQRLESVAASLSRDTRALLAGGDASGVDPRERGRVRGELRTVLDECVRRVWVDESESVSALIAQVGTTTQPSRLLGFRRDDPEGDIGALLDERSQTVDEQSEQLRQLRELLADALEVVNAQYCEEADALDESFRDPEFRQRFAKPSHELLELRTVAQRLLRQNKGR